MAKKSFSKITHLIFAVASKLEKNANQILAEKSNITFSEYKVLSVLNVEETNQTIVAKYLNITKSAVSRTMITLKNRDLIESKSKIGNREIFKLTESGIKVYDHAKDILHGDSNKSMVAVLDYDEQKFMIEKLEKLYHALSQ